MRKLPEIGKLYDCYDDGKVHEFQNLFFAIARMNLNIQL